MAIIKKLNSRVGIEVGYHRVIGVNLNYRDREVVICLASYITKEKRIEKYDPLEVVDIEVPKADFALFNGEDPIGIAYLWLKENVDGFDESIDDLEDNEVIEDDKKNEWRWIIKVY